MIREFWFCCLYSWYYLFLMMGFGRIQKLWYRIQCIIQNGVIKMCIRSRHIMVRNALVTLHVTRAKAYILTLTYKVLCNLTFSTSLPCYLPELISYDSPLCLLHYRHTLYCPLYCFRSMPGMVLLQSLYTWMFPLVFIQMSLSHRNLCWMPYLKLQTLPTLPIPPLRPFLLH